MAHLKLFCLTISCPIQKVIPNTVFPSLQWSQARTWQEQFNITFYSSQLICRQRGLVPPPPPRPTPAEKLSLLFIQPGSRLKDLHIQFQVHNHFAITHANQSVVFSGKCFYCHGERKELVWTEWRIKCELGWAGSSRRLHNRKSCFSIQTSKNSDCRAEFQRKFQDTRMYQMQNILYR